jgi:hypothetical protein
MGDDIGYWNISAYNHGVMGYRTPNIGRVAREGAILTGHYDKPSAGSRIAHAVQWRRQQILAELPRLPKAAGDRRNPLRDNALLNRMLIDPAQ